MSGRDRRWSAVDVRAGVVATAVAVSLVACSGASSTVGAGGAVVRRDPPIEPFDPELLGACYVTDADGGASDVLAIDDTLRDHVVGWVTFAGSTPPRLPRGETLLADGSGVIEFELDPAEVRPGEPTATAGVTDVPDRVTANEIIAERIATALDLGAQVHIGLSSSGSTLVVGAVLEGELAFLGNCGFARDLADVEAAAASVGTSGVDLLVGLASGALGVDDVPAWDRDEPHDRGM